MFGAIRQMLYADADSDDWPTPEQEAADIGTGTPNIWPNYSGSFSVQVIFCCKCSLGTKRNKMINLKSRDICNADAAISSFMALMFC
jgi:hypothetical protein